MPTIPDNLQRNLQEGRVVLFLGAGATIGATHPNNINPPSGERLAELLANRFLNESFAKRPLAEVSALAINESNLDEVQEYIASIFEPFSPADFHLIIPTLNWKALVTTNYDRVIERAYDSVENKVQTLVPFVKNGQRVEDKLFNLGKKGLVYLKLHGCVSDIHNPDAPLILSKDQYVSFRKSRDRLFSRLEELFYEYPFVFIGYSMNDQNLLAVMNELTNKSQAQLPQSYLVLPTLSDPEIRYYGSKRITFIQSTFEEFLREVNGIVPSQFRQLMGLQDISEHPIIKRLSLGPDGKLSPSILTLLNRDVEYVHPNILPTDLDPKMFYKGFFPDWTPICQNLDVPRKITDVLLREIFLESVDRDGTLPELFLLKAHAGAGKSVVLRRLAWEAAKSLDSVCLWLRKGNILNFDNLRELFRLYSSRIFLFIDPVSDYIDLIQEIYDSALANKIPITIIGAERINEWNIDCEQLYPFVNQEYELRNLSENEIDKLIELLEENGSLGHLKGLSREKQREELKESAGRQLLVALHEATLGKPFSDIVFDEYQSIVPMKARSLYLTVCIFHRLGVTTRAGLISRVHEIPFTTFKEELFKPLESVVFSHYDYKIQDQVYLSRHSHIAEIVFSRVLSTPQDRFDEYSRIIAALDYDYYSDRQAFYGITKANELIRLFSDVSMIRTIYSQAKARLGNIPWLLQQEAIFEMKSGEGDLNRAERLLTEAIDRRPNDRSILHSLSELSLRKSEESSNGVEKSKYRDEARQIALKLINQGYISSYPHHTLIKCDLYELEELLTDGDSRQIEDAIKRIDERIENAKQKFSDDEYIASAESDFLIKIKDNAKATEALRRAFDITKGSPYIATRLSSLYIESGNLAEAKGVLESALDTNPSSKILNYKYALILEKDSEQDNEKILYYLRRSFTDDDANYQAQFEYARRSYINGDIKRAQEIFDKLKSSRVSNRQKDKVQKVLVDKHNIPMIFTGFITSLESTYGFIKRDHFADEIFFHQSHIEDDVKHNLRMNSRVKFTLGFNFKGAIAVNISEE